MQIHPDIEKLVDAQAGNIVDAKTIRFQVFSGDVEIALEGCDTPTDGPLRQQRSGLLVRDS